MYISDLIFLHVLRGRMAEGPESHYELVPLDEAEIPPAFAVQTRLHRLDIRYRYAPQVTLP